MTEKIEAIRARLEGIAALVAELAGASAKELDEAIAALETTTCALRELRDAATERESRK
jgi:hypothetical protein